MGAGCPIEMEGDVRSVVPHADNNVYHSIPHPAGDPVMAANEDRVLEFFRTTFFDITTALECRLAPVCLTLRGVSIVRAFITLCPGGVRPEPEHLPHREPVRWQSRFHGHECVSLPKDELRKQADAFTGKVNIRGVAYSPPRT